ncbi:MAG TPA: hypothetical protein VGE52_12430 [Pirellulales bacterium]
MSDRFTFLRRPHGLGRLLMLGVLWTAIAGAVAAQSRRREEPRAVPRFGPEVNKVFFPDAAKELGPGGLDDPAGAAPGATSVASSGRKTSPTPSAPAPAAPAGEGGAWSTVVSPETLEDEIKTLASEIANSTKAKGKFKSSGYKDAEVQFANLAVLFGVVAAYDGEVRWKAQAGAARTLAAKVGFLCKQGSDESYDAAKNEGETLTALVRGDKVELEEGDGSTPPWPSVAELGPLMKRLDKALEVVKPMAADKAAFDADPAKFAREAGLISMIGRVIQDAEYNPEAEYKNFAAAMESAAGLAVQAGKQKQYDAAREAIGRIDKACNDCHGQFK